VRHRPYGIVGNPSANAVNGDRKLPKIRVRLRRIDYVEGQPHSRSIAGRNEDV